MPALPCLIFSICSGFVPLPMLLRSALRPLLLFMLIIIPRLRPRHVTSALTHVTCPCLSALISCSFSPLHFFFFFFSFLSPPSPPTLFFLLLPSFLSPLFLCSFLLGIVASLTASVNAPSGPVPTQTQFPRQQIHKELQVNPAFETHT